MNVPTHNPNSKRSQEELNHRKVKLLSNLSKFSFLALLIFAVVAYFNNVIPAYRIAVFIGCYFVLMYLSFKNVGIVTWTQNEKETPKKVSFFPSFLLILLACVLMPFPNGILYYTPYKTLIVVSMALLSLGYIIYALSEEKMSFNNRLSIIFLFVFITVGTFYFSYDNFVFSFETSAPNLYSVQVKEKYVDQQSENDEYYITVSPFGPFQEPLSFEVHESFYEDYSKNTMVFTSIHTGLFQSKRVEIHD